MIASIWVFFVLGDSTVAGEPPAYEQAVVSSLVHDRCPDVVENAIGAEFHALHPHHVICDSGWCKQKVQVMGS